MRKIATCILVVMLIATFCFAQEARNPTTVDYEAKTNLGHIGVQGQNVTGNPGYIELMGVDGYLHYIWVGQSERIMVASETTMKARGFLGGSSGTQGSFPSGNWNGLQGFGTVVGGQS